MSLLLNTTNTNAETTMDFADTLAQEVINPLSNINISVQMLAADLQNEEHLGFLDVILRSTARIDSFINQYLKDKTTI